MQRWAIALDGQARRSLKPELLELGSEEDGADGRRYLVFRDRFVGLRVAFAVGTKLHPFSEERKAVA